MALVFVKSRDLEHGRADGCGFKHTAGVRCAYKPRCIVIGVIYVDNDTNKVPLNWDILVSNLEEGNLRRDTYRGGKGKK